MTNIKVRYSINIFGKYFLIFALISFLGWAWETLYMLVISGELFDRGFMILPFCPIYGTTVLAIYFLLGTPKVGRGILKKIDVFGIRQIMYFLLSFIIPTVAELIVGKYFTEILNISLWDYSHLPYNQDGYISLPISLIWAIAIFAFMYFLFDRIKNFVFNIPHKAVTGFTAILLPIMIIDVTFSFLNIA